MKTMQKIMKNGREEYSKNGEESNAAFKLWHIKGDFKTLCCCKYGKQAKQRG